MSSGALFTRKMIKDNTYSLEGCVKKSVEKTLEGKMTYIMVDDEDDYYTLVQLICETNVGQSKRALTKEEVSRIKIGYLTTA